MPTHRYRFLYCRCRFWYITDFNLNEKLKLRKWANPKENRSGKVKTRNTEIEHREETGVMRLWYCFYEWRSCCGVSVPPSVKVCQSTLWAVAINVYFKTKNPFSLCAWGYMYSMTERQRSYTRIFFLLLCNYMIKKCLKRSKYANVHVPLNSCRNNL